MKTFTAIIAPRNEFIQQVLMTKVQGTTPLVPNSNPTTFGSTILAKNISNTTFEEVPGSRSKYTIDTNGIITLTEIIVILDTGLLTRNLFFPSGPPIALPIPTTSNGVLRVEISGDAGNTFVNMSGDIIGPKLVRATGLWINKIDTVPDGLQFRFLVKSTNGLPATVAMSNQDQIIFVLNKKLT